MSLGLVFWLASAFCTGFAELLLPGLRYGLALALGSLAALALCFCGSGLVLQYASFYMATGVAIYWLCRHDGLLGQQATVLAAIKPHKRGLVAVSGKEMQARSRSNRYVAVGSLVTIVKIVGDHLIVD